MAGRLLALPKRYLTRTEAGVPGSKAASLHCETGHVFALQSWERVCIIRLLSQASPACLSDIRCCTVEDLDARKRYGNGRTWGPRLHTQGRDYSPGCLSTQHQTRQGDSKLLSWPALQFDIHCIGLRLATGQPDSYSVFRASVDLVDTPAFPLTYGIRLVALHTAHMTSQLTAPSCFAVQKPTTRQAVDGNVSGALPT